MSSDFIAFAFRTLFSPWLYLLSFLECEIEIWRNDQKIPGSLLFLLMKFIVLHCNNYLQESFIQCLYIVNSNFSNSRELLLMKITKNWLSPYFLLFIRYYNSLAWIWFLIAPIHLSNNSCKLRRKLTNEKFEAFQNVVEEQKVSIIGLTYLIRSKYIY